jgi:hypothetical protein
MHAEDHSSRPQTPPSITPTSPTPMPAISRTRRRRSPPGRQPPRSRVERHSRTVGPSGGKRTILTTSYPLTGRAGAGGVVATSRIPGESTWPAVRAGGNHHARSPSGVAGSRISLQGVRRYREVTHPIAGRSSRGFRIHPNRSARSG